MEISKHDYDYLIIKQDGKYNSDGDFDEFGSGFGPSVGTYKESSYSF